MEAKKISKILAQKNSTYKRKSEISHDQNWHFFVARTSLPTLHPINFVPKKVHKNLPRTVLPTNNALLINFLNELRCRSFVIKHRLSIQIGAQTCENLRATCACSDWASILHTTIGGWANVLKPVRIKTAILSTSTWKLNNLFSFKGNRGEEEEEEEGGNGSWEAWPNSCFFFTTYYYIW